MRWNCTAAENKFVEIIEMPPPAPFPASNPPHEMWDDFHLKHGYCEAWWLRLLMNLIVNVGMSTKWIKPEKQVWVNDIFRLLLWYKINDVIRFFLINGTPQRKQILRARCVHSVKPRKSPLGQANSRPKTTEFRFVCAWFLWYGWHTARCRRRISPVLYL